MDNSCPRCGGRRVVVAAPVTTLWGKRAPYIGQVQIDVRTCPECNGTGRAPHPGPPVRS